MHRHSTGEANPFSGHNIRSGRTVPASAAIAFDGRVGPTPATLPKTPKGSVQSLPRRVSLGLKRAIDIVGSLAALVVLSPVLAVAAASIKLSSPGPVLFRQKRYGRDGQLFGILKFRSMRVDRGDVTGVNQTVDDDPRVTIIGRFLRRSNIDELPQLFNVLTGDMSLVGPRPHVPGMLAGGIPYEVLVPNYGERHRMRPGITGLAQISGLRGPTVNPRFARERIDYDVAYVDHWSLLLDIRILIVTVRTECLRGSGS